MNILINYFLLIVVVLISVRLDEAVTALKSSLIFTPPPIVFHIFTEDHLRDEFRRQVGKQMLKMTKFD